jgi:hypothetical protein
MDRFNFIVCICLLFGLITPGFAEEKPRVKSGTEKADDAEKADRNDKKTGFVKAVQKEGQVPEKPVGVPPPQQEPKAVAATAIFEQSGILTPKNHFVVEPSLQYAHSSSNRIAVLGYTIVPSVAVGVIDIREVEDNSFVAALAVRYGITNRFEAEVKVPYIYRTDSSTTSAADKTVPNTVFTSDGNGIGDIEFGLRYQINQPVGDGAYFIAGLRAKSNTGKDPFEVSVDPTTNLETELPTGSGFWGIQPSLTAIYPTDPAVLFGSISYMWNISRDISNFGKVDPGDVIEVNFGLGFALNEKTSLSIGYDHCTVGRVKINGTLLPATMITQVGSLLIGYSYRYSDKTSFSLSLGAGLTQAAPDVQLTLRVPIAF